MGFPEDISVGGHWIDHLFWLATILTGIAFIVVVVMIVWCLLRYRGKGRTAHYTHGNSRGALTLTLALAMVVFFAIDVNLAWNDHHAWEAVFGHFSEETDFLEIQVMPEQFAWNVRYAGVDGAYGTEDDVTTINIVHIPVDQPILVKLKAKDVLHSFFLPNLRVKQDCVPGMITALPFQATKTGTFEIACAELCGLGHYKMRGELIVQTRAEFDAWLKGYAAESPPDHDLWAAWDVKVRPSE